MMTVTLLFTYNSRITTQEQGYDSIPMAHAYEDNMTMMVCVIIKRNGGCSMAIYLGMAMEMP